MRKASVHIEPTTEHPGFIFPSNDGILWEDNLYERVWSTDLQNKLYIVIELLKADNDFSKPTSLGYIKKDISGPDGKMIYGSY